MAPKEGKEGVMAGKKPTQDQLVHLEASFAQSRHPDADEKKRLSEVTGGLGIEKITVSVLGAV